MKINQKTGYTPLGAVPMISTSLSKLTKEERCESIDMIKTYVETPPIGEYAKYKSLLSRPATQEEILNKIKENPLETNMFTNNGITYVQSYFGLFILTPERILTPVIVVMIPTMCVPQLLKCAIMEEPFPSDLLEVWTTDETPVSKSFYGKIRKIYYEFFPIDVTLVRKVSQDVLFKSLFQTLSKPSFLSRSQEDAWKVSLLKEYGSH